MTLEDYISFYALRVHDYLEVWLYDCYLFVSVEFRTAFFISVSRLVFVCHPVYLTILSTLSSNIQSQFPSHFPKTDINESVRNLYAGCTSDGPGVCSLEAFNRRRSNSHMRYGLAELHVLFRLYLCTYSSPACVRMVFLGMLAFSSKTIKQTKLHRECQYKRSFNARWP